MNQQSATDWASQATQELVSPELRALLESAVRKFGPERSADALRAWQPRPATKCIESGWRYCVLARAYGDLGDLVRDAGAAHPDKDSEGSGAWQFAQDALGLRLSEVDAVISAFDMPGTPKHRLLKDLLAAESNKMAPHAAQHI